VLERYVFVGTLVNQNRAGREKAVGAGCQGPTNNGFGVLILDDDEDLNLSSAAGKVPTRRQSLRRVSDEPTKARFG
jgi:hypothetical protein